LVQRLVGSGSPTKSRAAAGTILEAGIKQAGAAMIEPYGTVFLDDADAVVAKDDPSLIA
jgi:hypothetical protein